MRVPIACTLSADDADRRVDEWRRFLAVSVAAIQWVGDQQLRLRLHPAAEVLVAAVDLAQREKSCCGFFQFSVEVEAEGCWLAIGVPAGASGVLADFASLLPERYWSRGVGVRDGLQRPRQNRRSASTEL